MRISQDNEPAYEPRNDIERKICEAVSKLTNEEMMHLWTQANYPREDMDGVQIQIEHDYIAQTGVRDKPEGMFCGGTEVGVNYRDGEITLEELGIWT